MIIRILERRVCVLRLRGHHDEFKYAMIFVKIYLTAILTSYVFILSKLLF